MLNGQTHMGGGEERFRTTRWSLISEINNPNSDHSREILNNLFQDYWKPVYCYIRTKGNDIEKAKDLTQEFLCNVLFENNLFAKAQNTKGKFRSLLLTALQNFLISQNRYQMAQKRSIDRDILNIDLLNIASLPDPVQPYDNVPFEQWVEIFGCERLTGALLDRLTHRVHILEANGPSYRLKESQKRLKRPDTGPQRETESCEDDGPPETE